MHPKILLAGFCSIALLLGLSLLRFRLEPPREGRYIWRGYRTLLIAQAKDVAKAQSLLEHRGDRVLSLENQRVSVYDYDQWQHFPLVAISSVMDPLDPREDPYISKLSDYFYAWEGDSGMEGPPWSILYVETDDSPSRFAREVSPLFSMAGITYALPELEGMNENVLRFLLGVFVLSLAFVLGRSWWHIFILLLPWLASAINGRPEILFSNGLVALALVLIRGDLLSLWQAHLEYPLSRRDIASGLLSSARLGFLLFGSSLILIVFADAERAIPGLLVWAAAHIGWMGGELAFMWGRHSRRIHRLYCPLPLTENSTGRRFPAKRKILFVTAPLILPVVFLSGEGGNWHLPLPKFREGNISWEDLEALWEDDSPGDLPNLADYLAHRAYQESFFYGGTYQFPRPGGALRSTKYTSKDMGMGSSEVSLFEFTNSWYVDILAAKEGGGIASLLLRQDSPVSVALKPLVIPKPPKAWAWMGVFLGLLCGFYALQARDCLQPRVFSERGP